MIFTRSPYYLDFDIAPEVSAFTIALYIWSGDKNFPPQEVTYSITRENPEQTAANIRQDIAAFINDFIELNPIEPSSQINVNRAAVWIEWRVFNDNDGQAFYTGQDIALRGYYNGGEAENTTNNKKILIDTPENEGNRFFYVPVAVPVDATVTSYPAQTINDNISFAASNFSSEQFRYIKIDVGRAGAENYIEVTAGAESVFIYPKSEPLSNPVDVHFINKNGLQQILPFFKKRTDSLKVERENYQNAQGRGAHQFKEIGVNGRAGFKISSGFVDESTNEAFSQLLLSERVWIYEGNKLVPVNIDTNNIEFQTRGNDKLINYDIDFKYSFNQIATF